MINGSDTHKIRLFVNSWRLKFCQKVYLAPPVCTYAYKEIAKSVEFILTRMYWAKHEMLFVSIANSQHGLIKITKFLIPSILIMLCICLSIMTREVWLWSSIINDLFNKITSHLSVLWNNDSIDVLFFFEYEILRLRPSIY